MPPRPAPRPRGLYPPIGPRRPVLLPKGGETGVAPASLQCAGSTSGRAHRRPSPPPSCSPVSAPAARPTSTDQPAASSRRLRQRAVGRSDRDRLASASAGRTGAGEGARTDRPGAVRPEWTTPPVQRGPLHQSCAPASPPSLARAHQTWETSVPTGAVPGDGCKASESAPAVGAPGNRAVIGPAAIPGERRERCRTRAAVRGRRGSGAPRAPAPRYRQPRPSPRGVCTERSRRRRLLASQLQRLSPRARPSIVRYRLAGDCGLRQGSAPRDGAPRQQSISPSRARFATGIACRSPALPQCQAQLALESDFARRGPRAKHVS
jgi:hypothetical protein